MNSFDPMLRKGDVVRAEGLFRRLYRAAPEQQRRVMFNTLLKANFDQQTSTEVKICRKLAKPVVEV